MVSTPVRFALRLLALLLLGAASRVDAGGDPDADAFDVEANLLGSGLVRGLSAAWDACDKNASGGGGGDANASSVACQGLRLVRKALTRWSGERRAVELSNGVELVPLEEDRSGGGVGGGRASRKLEAGGAGAAGVAGGAAPKGAEERGLWGRMLAFLSGHEIRIRLPKLLPQGDNWAGYLGSLHRQHMATATGAGVAAARKKDKGGGALLAMMGMMGGMMMMMGLAGTGALAMKALGVASMALMMAIAAALKKLASKDDGGHHVSVVPVHAGGHDHGHHRRRRDASDPSGDDAHRLAYAAFAAAR